jgi:hypothetical protein
MLQLTPTLIVALLCSQSLIAQTCTSRQVSFQGTCLRSCPTSTIMTSTRTCVCPSGQVYEINLCRTPCINGQVRQSSGSCACPSGQVYEVNLCRTPCINGQIRNSLGSCVCPTGQVYEANYCRDPCPSGTQRQSDGSCQNDCVLANQIWLKMGPTTPLPTNCCGTNGIICSVSLAITQM